MPAALKSRHALAGVRRPRRLRRRHDAARQGRRGAGRTSAPAGQRRRRCRFSKCCREPVDAVASGIEQRAAVDIRDRRERAAARASVIACCAGRRSRSGWKPRTPSLRQLLKFVPEPQASYRLGARRRRFGRRLRPQRPGQRRQPRRRRERTGGADRRRPGRPGDRRRRRAAPRPADHRPELADPRLRRPDRACAPCSPATTATGRGSSTSNPVWKRSSRAIRSSPPALPASSRPACPWASSSDGRRAGSSSSRASIATSSSIVRDRRLSASTIMDQPAVAADDRSAAARRQQQALRACRRAMKPIVLAEAGCPRASSRAVRVDAGDADRRRRAAAHPGVRSRWPLPCR